MTVAILVATAVLTDSAHARMRARIDGKRFTAAAKRGGYVYLAHFFLTGISGRGTAPGTQARFDLNCGPIAPGDALPATVACVTSSVAVVNADNDLVGGAWMDEIGTLQATVTSMVTLPSRSRWRIRGTFSGTLTPSANAVSPIEVENGRFSAVFHSIGGGGD